MGIRTFRAGVVAAAGLAAVLAVAGCSVSINSHGDAADSGHMMDSDGMMGSDESRSQETTQGAADDIMFAQMMIPHHAQAVEMSTLAETRASNPQIKALAAQIKAAQQPEIDQMKSWLQEWGMPVMSADDIMGAHMGHGMSGMLTDEQMAQLESASGIQFDVLYATYMIEHHKGAIEMAQDVADSKDPRVAALAQAIITSQQAEIAQLEAILQSLGATSSP